MALFAIEYIKRRCIIAKQAGKERDASQSRYQCCVRHAERWCVKVIHIDDDVAVCVYNRIQRQDAVFSFFEDKFEDGSDALNDTKVKLRLRD